MNHQREKTLKMNKNMITWDIFNAMGNKIPVTFADLETDDN